MHLPPFHKDNGVGLLSALASQNRSQNISRISGSADTNTQKVGGRCYADITTQGTEGVKVNQCAQGRVTIGLSVALMIRKRYRLMVESHA